VNDSDADRVEPTAHQGTGDWWTSIDAEILNCLAARDAMTPGEISSALGLSEGEVVALLAMLAPEGKVTICQVKLGGEA
jgi:DNA-binding Lrp family transcriptional regulator